jgi:hypothetical protein
MAFIDGTAVNVALPALQANLNATAVDVQWVVEAYALLLALLLVGGSLGDHYGVAEFFDWDRTFALASAACGFASTFINSSRLARRRTGAAPLFRAVPPSSAVRSQRTNADAPSVPGPAQRHHNRTRPGDGRLADRTRIMARSFLHQHPTCTFVIIISSGVPKARSRERRPRRAVGAALAALGLGARFTGWSNLRVSALTIDRCLRLSLPPSCSWLCL